MKKKKPPPSSSSSSRLVQIRATKKGQPPIRAERRKHFWVTVVKNVVSGRDEEIELLCSRLGKRLGATARLVIEEKGGERWIEISGAHEKRARELLESEGVFVGLRKEKCALEEEGEGEEGSKRETKKEPRAKPRHANKRYWDTKTGLIKDSMTTTTMEEEEDPVKPEDVLRVKQLRETNRDFSRFCELMRKYPFWSHRYDKLAAMYFERRGGKEEEDEERRKKRRRCEIAFEEDEDEEEEEDEGDGRDEDRHRGHPKSLEELGMVASASDFRMSREERAKAAKQKKSAVVGLQDAKREKEQQDVEEYEDIATKMLRLRGFAPARKKPTTTSTTTTTATTSTTTTARRKPAMPPKKKIDSSVGISSGASAAFGRKAWSQKQFDKEDLIMSTTDDDEEEEQEEEESLRQTVASRPLVGGRFLDNKRNDESAFPSLRPTRRAAPPTSRTSEHRLPHEEFQQTTMSEEDALKLALSLSADEHARERMKMDEELERDLEVARAVSLSAREEEEARKRSSLSNDIAQTLRQLGFDRDVSETLANDVLPAMPTHQDVIDLLGTLGIEKQVAANFANFIVLNNENSAPDGNTGTDATEEEEEEEEGEEEMFFNLSLRELTGTDSNRDLILYVQKMEHREDAGEFLRESFGGNEETFRLGANIWDAGSSSRRR